MDETKQISKVILDSSKVPLLFGGIISYFIGGGFVSFVGKNVDWFIFWLGLGIILMFFLSSQYLPLIFGQISLFQNIEPKSRPKYKNTFLQLGLTTLSVGAISTIFLFYLIEDTFVIWFFLALLFLLNVILVIPPFNVRNRGYGDLINAFNLAVLTPAFAQSLQLPELHRSLIMITFPGFFLLLSLFLAFSLEMYASDLKNNRFTLMTVIGWKTGMNFHNLFLLLTYFSYGIVALLSLSFNLLIPAIAAFPFSVLQFWEMIRIGNGGKPRWKFLYLSAGASIGIFVYFLLFNLWFR